MAGIKCRECNGAVSTSARSCPHCGATPKKFKPKGIGLREVCIGFVGLMVLRGVLGVVGSAEESSPKKPTQTATTSVVTTSGSSSELLRAVSTISSDESVASTTMTLSNATLCKAGIAVVMGRPIESITSVDTGDTVALSYTRKSDGTKWDYQCKVKGERLIWAAKGGRWRNGPNDNVVTYSIGATNLAISESLNGEVISSDLFPLNGL